MNPAKVLVANQYDWSAFVYTNVVLYAVFAHLKSGLHVAVE